MILSTSLGYGVVVNPCHFLSLAEDTLKDVFWDVGVSMNIGIYPR